MCLLCCSPTDGKTSCLAGLLSLAGQTTDLAYRFQLIFMDGPWDPWAFLFCCSSALCKPLDSSLLPKTCTGYSVFFTKMLADMVNFQRNRQRAQIQFQNTIQGYSHCIPAHVFLGMCHMVLHLQDKLCAYRKKLCSASAVQSQLPLLPKWFFAFIFPSYIFVALRLLLHSYIVPT